MAGLWFRIHNWIPGKNAIEKKSQRKETCQTWISHRIWSSEIWPDDVQPFILFYSELTIYFRRTWLCQEKRTGNLYMDSAFKLNVTQVRSSRFC